MTNIPLFILFSGMFYFFDCFYGGNGACRENPYFDEKWIIEFNISIY